MSWERVKATFHKAPWNSEVLLSDSELYRRHPTTNAEFAIKNLVFREACVLARVRVTKRQASKFRRGKGLAFRKREEATHAEAARVS